MHKVGQRTLDLEDPSRRHWSDRFGDLITGAGILILEGPPDHYVFPCEVTEAGNRLEPTICVERRAIHERVAETARHFFDRHLLNR